MMQRRLFTARIGAAAAAALASLGLAGCASMNTFTAEVSTFGDWPAGRTPGTYAFDRLPSQQADGDAQQRLEDAARGPLERAGFRPAEPGTEPELLVQVAARVDRTGLSAWDDPLWWRGGWGSVGYSRTGPWRGPRWGVGVNLHWDGPRFDREVAVLVRERASARPLFEAHASSEGYASDIGRLLPPLMAAALQDFPATGPNPRRVSVPM